VYPAVLEERLPAAWHRTDRYANNRIECDHGRLKARLRPMRGLKQDRSARVVIAGHALVQNIRRGHYELAVEEPTNRRLAVAFDERSWRLIPSGRGDFSLPWAGATQQCRGRWSVGAEAGGAGVHAFDHDGQLVAKPGAVLGVDGRGQVGETPVQLDPLVGSGCAGALRAVLLAAASVGSHRMGMLDGEMDLDPELRHL
jgi:DDE domain